MAAMGFGWDSGRISYNVAGLLVRLGDIVEVAPAQSND